MDKLAIEMGFNDAEEMRRLVAMISTSTPARRAAFDEWKRTDGTKQGLAKLHASR